MLPACSPMQRSGPCFSLVAAFTSFPRCAKQSGACRARQHSLTPSFTSPNRTFDCQAQVWQPGWPPIRSPLLFCPLPWPSSSLRTSRRFLQTYAYVLSGGTGNFVSVYDSMFNPSHLHTVAPPCNSHWRREAAQQSARERRLFVP